MAESSGNDRQYGTFEVSVIEIDPENEYAKESLPSSPVEYDSNHGDCCFFMNLIYLPFQLGTYRIFLFHVINLIFALAGSAAMGVIYTLGISSIIKEPTTSVSILNALLRKLIEIDAYLFNLSSPPHERVSVFSSQENIFYGPQIKFYFGLIKPLCSGIPGFLSTSIFAWSIHNLFSIIAKWWKFQENGLPQDMDLMLLLGILILYASTFFIHVLARISRHVTIFFCAEFMLYASY
jgi:hypothetical protein